jgi:hypothetical protein
MSYFLRTMFTYTGPYDQLGSKTSRTRSIWWTNYFIDSCDIITDVEINRPTPYTQLFLHDSTLVATSQICRQKMLLIVVTRLKGYFKGLFNSVKYTRSRRNVNCRQAPYYSALLAEGCHVTWSCHQCFTPVEMLRMFVCHHVTCADQ